MKNFMKSLILTTTFLSTVTISSFAEELPTVEDKATMPRISVDGAYGVNLFLPYIQGRVAYRLPIPENRLEILLSHSLNVTICAGIPNITMLGANYYLSNTENKTKGLQPFISGSIGAMYLLNNSPCSGNQKSVSNFQFQMPVVQAGIGTDLNITENIAITVSANTGFPIFFRPEGALKVRF